jgi:hypothetical protein
MAVYYRGGQIKDWLKEPFSVTPDGHLPPGDTVAFCFSFERVPYDSSKLLSDAPSATW